MKCSESIAGAGLEQRSSQMRNGVCMADRRQSDRDLTELTESEIGNDCNLVRLVHLNSMRNLANTVAAPYNTKERKYMPQTHLA